MEILASSVPRLGSQAKPLQTSALPSNTVFTSDDGVGCRIITTGYQCLALRTLSSGWNRRKEGRLENDPETGIFMVQPLQLSVSSHVTVSGVHSWFVVDLLKQIGWRRIRISPGFP